MLVAQLIWALPAQAGTPMYFGVDKVVQGSPTPWLANAETAITNQSKVLQTFWGTPWAQWSDSNPDVTIYIGTWLELVTHGVNATNCSGIAPDNGVCGYHIPGQIILEVNYNYPNADTKVLSHEVDETLEDPNLNTAVDGHLIEIDDPVYHDTYVSDNGTTLSDFTLPSWWYSSYPPYDYLGDLTSPSGY